jgi:succinylglutamate desuccinylase
MKRLKEESLLHAGEVTVLAGNVTALGSGKRFLERDLNRGWSEERLHALMQQSMDALTAEDREQRELCVAIDDARRQANGPVIVVDLHTSSAPGLPFVLFSDTLAQRRFVAAFPIPVIIGLVEQVDGVLTEFFARRGCVTFCVEGGQHESDSSVDALEAVLWLSLAKAGMINGDLNVVTRAAQVLDEQRRGLPRVLEVLSRHSIVPEDGFVMEPGFKNIDVVSRGQRLARDVRGEILAPDNGVVVLPLYQKLGSDGFFWARAVSWPHMWAAAVLRTLRLDTMVGVLPGVERAADPNRVVIRTASPTTRALLRLMGFRRECQAQGHLVWERTPDAR